MTLAFSKTLAMCGGDFDGQSAVGGGGMGMGFVKPLGGLWITSIRGMHKARPNGCSIMHKVDGRNTTESPVKTASNQRSRGVKK